MRRPADSGASGNQLPAVPGPWPAAPKLAHAHPACAHHPGRSRVLEFRSWGPGRGSTPTALA